MRRTELQGQIEGDPYLHHIESTEVSTGGVHEVWQSSSYLFSGHSRHCARRWSKGTCVARSKAMRNSILTFLLGLSVATAVCLGFSPQIFDTPEVEIALVDDDAKGQHLAPLILALLATYPLNADVTLEVLPIKGSLGRTWWDEELGKYRIQIESEQSARGQVDALIHEWAHAMVWDASQRTEDQGHDALWGVAYARAYRAWLTVIESE